MGQLINFRCLRGSARQKLTTHHSPLTTHHSPLTTHHSPLTTHHSPLTTHSRLNDGQKLVGIVEDQDRAAFIQQPLDLARVLKRHGE